MKRGFLSSVFSLILVIVMCGCRCSPSEKRPPTLLKTASGIETTEFQLHESILFDAVKLKPRTGYQVQIVGEDGEVITELGLSTDRDGQIPETVLWYNIGARPCVGIEDVASARAHLSEYEISDSAYAGKNYTVRIKNKKPVREMTFRVAEEMIRPVLYAANSRGCHKTGFLIGEQDVWVVGRNFPKGSLIRLWAVDASSDWRDGAPLDDKTKQYGDGLPAILELKADETGFKKLLWPRGHTSIGSYDIVAEVVTYPFGSYHASATAEVQNVVSYLSHSGFVVQRRPGVAEPLEVNIAGVRQSSFTFRSTFLTTEDVYVGVDPCMQPSYVGQTAHVYIVADKTDAQWTTDPNLTGTDVTGFVETIAVNGICGNCWNTLAWASPLTPGDYDVVLDFNKDGAYTPGTDLIDSLDNVGFTVSEIRVDSISFNYGGSGAVTIYDNKDGSFITAPEYYSAGHVIKQAAWVKSGAYSVQANFVAVPTVNSAKIWAESGMGGLNSSGSPVTVTFSGGNGNGTFSVNSVPTTIGKHTFSWDWKYKDVNGSPSATLNMGATGEHIVYTTYSTPDAPMVNPWLEVLDRSCAWAQGLSNIVDARNAVTAGLNAIGDDDGDVDYNPANAYTTGPFSAWQFNLTDFLDDLGAMTSMQINCADCANALQVYQNALGLGLEYRILDMGGPTNYIDPIGNGNTSNSTDPVEDWGTTSWGWHCVGWLTGDIVYDACLHLDGTPPPSSTPCSRLDPANMAFPTYRDLLAPASTPCNPDEQNVCTVF